MWLMRWLTWLIKGRKEGQLVPDSASILPLNPDHLHKPGSVSFFYDPRTGQVDFDDYPLTHADMLNRDDCKLGRAFLLPEQHDFGAVPLTRSKVTCLGVVAGRLGEVSGRHVISIWNDLDEELTRKVGQALADHVPKVRQSFSDLNICTDGYRNGKPWRKLSVANAAAAPSPCHQARTALNTSPICAMVFF